jgi:hypothetical protein
MPILAHDAHKADDDSSRRTYCTFNKKGGNSKYIAQKNTPKETKEIFPVSFYFE